MSTQPRKLCKLQKGKALGAFDTFVDTFNWMVDFCANLIGEGEEPSSSEGRTSSLKVDRTVSDRPVIRGAGGGGANIPPKIITDIRLGESGVEVKTWDASTGSESDWTKVIGTVNHSEV